MTSILSMSVWNSQNGLHLLTRTSSAKFKNDRNAKSITRWLITRLTRSTTALIPGKILKRCGDMQIMKIPQFVLLQVLTYILVNSANNLTPNSSNLCYYLKEKPVVCCATSVENNLAGMISRISSVAGLSKTYTHHWIKETVAIGLKQRGTDLQSTISLPWHCTVKSLVLLWLWFF